MFDKVVYTRRRAALVSAMAGFAPQGKRGIAIFLGNTEAPQNYRGNDYKFRQDSSFLYYFGIDEPDFAAIIDLDSAQDCIYANNVDIDDIIWMGPQPDVASKAQRVGVGRSESLASFDKDVAKALSEGRPVHFLPPSRYFNTMKISQLLSADPTEVRTVAAYDGKPHASEELVMAVVSMRIIKEACEIEEIDKACAIGYLMHTEARRGCKPGAYEQDIVGRMEGVTLSKGWGVSFATILSQNGETLHNHRHDQIITPGRLLVVDAGSESNTHYASDFTRTYPCSGKFTSRQRDIYDIVEGCNELAFRSAMPGVTYRSVHLQVARQMLEGLKALNLVTGNIDDMVEAGIAGLFQPHGLGHNMGLDVHDMEDFGENYVGYEPNQQRSGQLGLGSLRMARLLRPGHVITDEPGIYFIPALIAKWKAEGTDKGMVNYAKLEAEYLDFGGIRLEDDLLITETGARRLGPERLPIKSSDIEEVMSKE